MISRRIVALGFVRLDPPQPGDPLNYFIYPYGEVAGKPFAVESKFSFQDRMNGSD